MNLDPSTTEMARQSGCHTSASAFNPFTQNFKCSNPDSATSSTAVFRLLFKKMVTKTAAVVTKNKIKT